VTAAAAAAAAAGPVMRAALYTRAAEIRQKVTHWNYVKLTN